MVAEDFNSPQTRTIAGASGAQARLSVLAPRVATVLVATLVATWTLGFALAMVQDQVGEDYDPVSISVRSAGKYAPAQVALEMPVALGASEYVACTAEVAFALVPLAHADLRRDVRERCHLLRAGPPSLSGLPGYCESFGHSANLAQEAPHGASWAFCVLPGRAGQVVLPDTRTGDCLIGIGVAGLAARPLFLYVGR